MKNISHQLNSFSF